MAAGGRRVNVAVGLLEHGSVMPRPTASLVLASSSPRRRELLERLGLKLIIDPPHVDESVRPGEQPEAYVRRLALAKAEEVAPRHLDAWVLAADTTVVRDGEVLGKPETPEAALQMLGTLEGRGHIVLTAVALGGRGRGVRVVGAEVTFAQVGPAALRWYVGTGEPLDKAGGYAVQGCGAFLVERITGSHSAVIGLPLVETLAVLAEAGYPLPWENG
jgi:septum formation protein